MRVWKILALLVIVALLSSCAARPAYAQTVNTIPYAVSSTTPVMNAVMCTGGATSTQGAIPNRNQTVHFITWTTTGSPSAVTVTVAGSYDGTNFRTISPSGTDSSGNIIVYGYYAALQISANCSGGTTPTITVNYSGISIAATPLPGSQDDITLYTKNVCESCSAGSNFTGPQINTPYGDANGYLILKFNSAPPSGARFDVFAERQGIANASVAGQFNVEVTSNVQIFPIPSSPATDIAFQFIANGASAATYTAYYMFAHPGAPANIDPCASNGLLKTSLPISISMATTISLVDATATPGAVYVCGVHVDLSGTGATLAFEDGTGATCGTNTVALTGTYTPTSDVFINSPDDRAQFWTRASFRLCAVTGGTVNAQGYFTYVIAPRGQ